MLPLLNNYETAMTAVQRYMDTTGSGTAKEIEQLTTAGGNSTLEQFSMTTSGPEMSIEVGLAKLDPTLTTPREGHHQPRDLA